MDTDDGNFVRKSIQLDAEAAQVWKALTDPAITKQYYFGCEFISDWKPGSPVESRFEYEGEQRIATKGVIVAAKEHELLEFTCYTPEAEKEPSKHSKLTYEFREEQGGTRLSVTQGPFPDEQTFQEIETSCEIVLQGLKRVLDAASPRSVTRNTSSPRAGG